MKPVSPCGDLVPAYLPELQKTDGIGNSAILHVVDMKLKIRLQTLFVSLSLVQEAVDLLIVDVPARHDVDVDILFSSPRVLSAKPDRRRLLLGRYLSLRASRTFS